MEFADRITVLKGGEVEDTMPASEATVERLTKAVVGERELKPHKNEGGTCREEVVLKLEDLSVKNDRDLRALIFNYIREKSLESPGLQEMVRKNWQRLLPD